MHLDGVLVNALSNEEVVDLVSLVALELDDLSEFFVVDESSVACKFLRMR